MKFYARRKLSLRNQSSLVRDITNERELVKILQRL